MNRLRRVVSSTIISLLGQAVTWTSTLLLTITYGRFLGDVKFGELFFAVTFVLLMGIPIESGYDQQIIRGVAEESDKALRYFSNVVLIKVSMWLVIYGLILLVSWLLGYDAEVRILVGICGLTLLIDVIKTTFASLHYALERVVFPVVGNILEKGLSALIGIFLLKNGAGVQTMAFVLLGGSLISGIWQATWFFRLVGTGFVIDKALIRKLILTNIPFFVYGVLSVIYGRIDTVLLSLMTSNAVVGWYGAAYRLFDTLSFLPNLIIMTIMYPIFSKLSLSSDVSLKLAVEKSVNFLLFCGIPIATGAIIAAPNIIGFLYYRVEFSHAVPALQALAPGLVFLYINTALGTTILSKKQDKKIPIMAAIALVFNIGLNLILIPMYQHVGAAIVTSLTEVLLFGLAVVFIPKHLLSLGNVTVGVKATIASLVMAMAIWYLREYNIFVIVLVAMPVYATAALLLGTIAREDLQALYSAIRYKAQSRTSEPLAHEAVQEQASTLLYRADTFSENMLEITMTIPAIRLQSKQQRPSTRREQIVPVSKESVGEHTATSKISDVQGSYKEHLIKGYHYQLTGAYGDAMQEYRIVILNAPDLLSEVISNVRALLKLVPEYSVGHRVLGDAYMRQGEYSKAMEEYSKVAHHSQKGEDHSS